MAFEGKYTGMAAMQSVAMSLATWGTEAALASSSMNETASAGEKNGVSVLPDELTYSEKAMNKYNADARNTMQKNYEIEKARIEKAIEDNNIDYNGEVKEVQVKTSEEIKAMPNNKYGSPAYYNPKSKIIGIDGAVVINGNTGNGYMTELDGFGMMTNPKTDPEQFISILSHEMGHAHGYSFSLPYKSEAFAIKWQNQIEKIYGIKPKYWGVGR